MTNETQTTDQTRREVRDIELQHIAYSGHAVNGALRFFCKSGIKIRRAYRLVVL